MMKQAQVLVRELDECKGYPGNGHVCGRERGNLEDGGWRKIVQEAVLEPEVGREEPEEA